jgi:peptidoglycan/LPS O-acetylase OafA/YrhL
MEKIKYLDGLRGLAALIVVLSHFVVVFYPALYTGEASEVHFVSELEVVIAGTPLNLLYNGNFAVCIFFILSGYVLTYRFFRDKDTETLKSGAFRRYIRLLVPVLFSNLVALILMKASLFYNVQAGSITKSTFMFTELWKFNPSFWDFLKESFFGVFFLDQCNYNPVLWTMTYEFIGSFMVFILAALIGRFKYRRLIYAVLCVLLFRTYYVAFLIGFILSDLTFNGYLEIFRNWIAKLILAGLLLGSYPAGMDVSNTMYIFFNFMYMPIDPIFFHMLGSICIMLALLNSQRLQKFFSSRPFVYLGRISFSMYLIHMIVIGSLSSYLFLVLNRSLSYDLSFVIVFAVSLIVIFLVSNLVSRYVDEKGILLSRRVYLYVKGKAEMLRHPERS